MLPYPSHPVFGSDALLHVVYLQNRLWHSNILRTPYKVYFSEKPDLSHLDAFDSLVTPPVSPVTVPQSSITAPSMTP
jgi:hypothetical protein